MALWLVRAGSHGEYEQKFLEENRIYLTWHNLNKSPAHSPSWARSARRGSSGRALDRRRTLVFDIALHRLQRRTAYRSNIVRPMPEVRLPIELPQMHPKVPPRTARRNRLQIVDQYRQLQRRMDRHQQMDVVGLAAKFQQAATPGRQGFSKSPSRYAKRAGVRHFLRYRVTNTIWIFKSKTA